MTAVGGLSALESSRLGPKPKEALPRRYDADMMAALKLGQVRRLFTGGNAVVWPERYRQVGYYYEVEKDVLKLKPMGKALTSTLEQMFREEVLPPLGRRRSGWRWRRGLSLCRTLKGILWCNVTWRCF